MSIQETFFALSQNNKSAPIIIVPGILIFYAGKTWKKILKKNGYTAEIANLYSIISTLSIDEQARRLSLEIERILAEFGAEKCHLLAFSMGGIASLRFLKNYNFRNRVLKCICAAAPFDGIPRYLDALSPFRVLIRGLPEIMRGNELLMEISKKEDAPRAELYTVRGSADFLCGEKSCNLSFANNLPTTNSGHLTICCGLNKQIVEQVLKILAA